MGPFSQLVARRFHRLRSTLLAGCLRNETGSAVVELGLMLAFLGVPLLLATSYFGVLLIARPIRRHQLAGASECFLQLRIEGRIRDLERNRSIQSRNPEHDVPIHAIDRKS